MNFTCLYIVDIMSSNNNNTLLINLRLILEKDKLNGKFFLNWERNLRIILRFRGREHDLKTTIPTLTANSKDDEKATHKAIYERSVIVNIIQQLKTMFRVPAKVERYQTHKAILECELEVGSKWENMSLR